MALALTVEDGTNVAGANSYATLDQIKAFNAQRGVKLPSTDDGIIAQAAMAMDYLASFEPRLAGKRTFGSLQSLAWPRTGVKAYSSSVGRQDIPADIVNVHCYLAGIAGELDLYGNQDSRAVIKDAIGPLDTEYAPNAGATYGPIIPTVFAMLRPYMLPGGVLRTFRG